MRNRTPQAELLAKLSRGLASLIETNACPLDGLLAAYLEDQSVKVTRGHLVTLSKRLPKLIREVRAMADALGAPRIVDAAELRCDLLDTWRVQQLRAGMAHQTVRQYLTHLKGLTAWGHGKGRLDVDPLATLELPPAGKAQQKRPRGTFTEAEMTALLIAAQGLDAELQGKYTAPLIPQAPFLLALAYTACRLGEASAAVWADWHPTTGLLRIRAEEAKSGRERFVAVPSYVADALEALRAVHRTAGHGLDSGRMFLARGGTELCRHNVHRWFGSVLRRAKVSRFDGAGKARCPHSVRHFATTRLAGQNPLAAQVQAGHKSYRTTEGYVHPGSELVRDAMQGLPSLLRGFTENQTRVWGPVGVSGESDMPKSGSQDGVGDGTRTRDPQNHNLVRGSRSQPEPRTFQVAGLAPGESFVIPSAEAFAALIRSGGALLALLEQGPVRVEAVR